MFAKGLGAGAGIFNRYSTAALYSPGPYQMRSARSAALGCRAQPGGEAQVVKQHEFRSLVGPGTGRLRLVLEPARGRLFQVGKTENQAAAFHQFDGRAADEVYGGCQVDGEVVGNGYGAGDEIPATQD